VVVDVAGEVIPQWASEEIPDTDRLYMRVHQNLLHRDGRPIPGAFIDHGGGMSTDWERYSTPEETRQRARKPQDNAVISLLAGEVRRIPDQIVRHAPLPENRAHTDVIGEKTAEVRVLFLRLYQLVHPLESTGAES
jgi:hypothetical protein